MDNKKLNKELRNQARSLGLCDEWYKEWQKNESKQDLIRKYIRGIDFCIMHDYPSLDFARKNFDRRLLCDNGIFLDVMINDKNIPKAILLGNTVGALFYSDDYVGNVYVRHVSNVSIIAKGASKVFVETYENCIVSVKASEEAKVFVYHHSGEISTEGNVVIRER